MTDERRDVVGRLEKEANNLGCTFSVSCGETNLTPAKWCRACFSRHVAALLRNEGEPDAWLHPDDTGPCPKCTGTLEVQMVCERCGYREAPSPPSPKEPLSLTDYIESTEPPRVDGTVKATVRAASPKEPEGEACCDFAGTNRCCQFYRATPPEASDLPCVECGGRAGHSDKCPHGPKS